MARAIEAVREIREHRKQKRREQIAPQRRASYFLALPHKTDADQERYERDNMYPLRERDTGGATVQEAAIAPIPNWSTPVRAATFSNRVMSLSG